MYAAYENAGIMVSVLRVTLAMIKLHQDPLTLAQDSGETYRSFCNADPFDVQLASATAAVVEGLALGKLKGN